MFMMITSYRVNARMVQRSHNHTTIDTQCSRWNMPSKQPLPSRACESSSRRWAEIDHTHFIVWQIYYSIAIPYSG